MKRPAPAEEAPSEHSPVKKSDDDASPSSKRQKSSAEANDEEPLPARAAQRAADARVGVRPRAELSYEKVD